MRRALAITLLLLGYATAQAGGEKDKVHNLAGGNLKIDGAVAEDDPKIKVSHPDVNITVDLPAKVYKVKLPAGKLQLDIMSTAIDPVLVIQDKSGKQLAFDDDGGEGLNSRLQFQAPKEDTYNIVAASLKGAGDFTLTVKVLAAGQPVVGGGGSGSFTLYAAALSGEGNYVLTVKAAAGGKETKFEGQVDANDPKVTLKVGGKQLPLPAKKHQIKLDAGARYQIDLVSKSDGFDPLLIVHDSTNKQLAFDDDGGGFPHSRLQFTPPKAGGAPVPPKGKVLEVGAGGLKLTGSLSQETKNVIYQVKLDGGKSYVIEMMSPDQQKLDPYIEVRDAAGKKLAEDDDGAGDLNSRLVFRAPENGVYQIVARSFLGVGIGDYTLEVRQQE
jgi:hypothetical protein